jgi:hypothetical protein
MDNRFFIAIAILPPTNRNKGKKETTDGCAFSLKHPRFRVSNKHG